MPVVFSVSTTAEAVPLVLSQLSSWGLRRSCASFTLLIDGRSGSGKSTLADLLGAELCARVVRLDSFYPGWSGLMAASRMVATDVLAARGAGYRAWDWEHDRPGQWVPLASAAPLIVEGVGALSRENLAAAQHRTPGRAWGVEVRAGADRRRARALARDPEFVDYWEMWAAQEEGYEDHRASADVVINNQLVDRGPTVNFAELCE